jgi:parvulin-like peptidyl-prolyl isomerase
VTILKFEIIKNIIRNPLLHFFILGVLIYVAFGSFSVQEYSDSQRTIVVSPTTINWLEDTWEKRWNRPPTKEELNGLINQYIRETILYREALALQLDKNDIIVRRRLAQKFEFLTQDLIEVPKPSDEELAVFFNENINKYKIPDSTTFTHIFFDPDKRGDKTLDDAEESKAKLNKLDQPPTELDQFGDNFMLQSYYPEKSEQEISKLFGTQFAKEVSELSPGQWNGPVLSGYGTHLVYVNGRNVAQDPEFDNVKELVKEDWSDKKREEINDQFYTDLLSSYEVIIEEESPEVQVLRKEEKAE